MATAYPTSVELAEFLYDAQVIKSFPVDYTLYDNSIKSAIDAWEKETRWNPFIAEVEDSTTDFYDFDDNMLDFKGGYISITSVAIDDVPATEFNDYRSFPAQLSPKRYLLLYSLPSRKVTVVGKRGFQADVPDDVYRAIISYGASLAWTQLKANGILQSVKQGDVSYTFMASTPQSPTNQFAQWQGLFQETVTRYKRGMIL